MVTWLGFTMFHLEVYRNRAADEPAYVPVQVLRTRNAMSAFSVATRRATR